MIKGDVVEASRVFQQMDDPHRVGVVPAIGQIEVRQVIGNGIVEGKLAALDQLHHGDRGEALADRSSPEDSVAIDRATAIRLEMSKVL